MHAQFSQSELAARREIESRIAVAPTEKARDQLREELQRLFDSRMARLRARQAQAAKKSEPVPARIPVAPVDLKPRGRTYTLTSAQKWARANWSNQHTSAAEQRADAAARVAVAQVRAVSRTRIYRLFDGTLFYADNGEVIPAVPQGCRVFSACDPPNYKTDSHVIEGYFFDESISHWRPKPK
jgi:hypothetical protein